jgi:hypothetical protein
MALSMRVSGTNKVAKTAEASKSGSTDLFMKVTGKTTKQTGEVD